jgi:hypothetical protein
MAEPLLSTLDDVVTKSPDVVIATYEGPVDAKADLSPSKLHVQLALRGKLSGEIVAGIGGGHPHVKIGTRVVAFLGPHQEWSYVGEALDGMSLDDAMTVSGFYDFNAHVVTPSVLTLDQLRDKLAGRRITWRFEGELVALADDGSKIVPTPWTIVAELPERGTATVGGLPTIKNLPAPSISIGGWDPIVSLVWRTSWPRPLVIRGALVGRRGDTLLARFHVEQPDLLRVRDITKYLDDPNTSHAVFRMRIVWSDGEQWSVVANEDYSSLKVYDAKKREVPWGEFDMRNRRHIGSIDIGPARAGTFLDERGDTRVLVQEILRGPLSVKQGARKGTLELVDVTLAPAVRVK